MVSAAAHVNSPARNTPKKPRQHAAHSCTAWEVLTILWGVSSVSEE